MLKKHVPVFLQQTLAELEKKSKLSDGKNNCLRLFKCLMNEMPSLFRRLPWFLADFFLH